MSPCCAMICPTIFILTLSAQTGHTCNPNLASTGCSSSMWWHNSTKSKSSAQNGHG
uniref:Uncharacterized protein n=1 Tax=Rhizophora mucronata TaxID=61149 RepID=A0A2P2IKF9_RHIMU